MEGAKGGIVLFSLLHASHDLVDVAEQALAHLCIRAYRSGDLGTGRLQCGSALCVIDVSIRHAHRHAQRHDMRTDMYRHA